MSTDGQGPDTPTPFAAETLDFVLKRIDDLLTEDQRKALYADLAEMAKQRRQAENAAATWYLP